MFNDFERYAVYWVPKRPDPLGPFGDTWTGWCAEHGEHRPRGDFPDLPSITRRLCRHGLHGVINAPFRLAPGRSQFALEHALAAIAEESVSFKLPRLELAVVGGRVALVPAQGSEALSALVARVRAALAPLADPDLAEESRPAPAPGARTGALVPLVPSAQQQFHLPLSDVQPVEKAHALKDALAPLVEHLLAAPRSLSVISLIGDPGGERPVRALHNYALLDWPLRPGARVLETCGPQVLAPMPEVQRKSDMAM